MVSMELPMPLPAILRDRLALPAIAAPMFLVSGPDLVVETCRAGVLGSFPALNQRTSAGFEAWLDEIETRLAGEPRAAPFAVNLIVHRSNARLDADLAIIVRHRVPVVITSLGAVAGVVEAVHAYGGIVLHDVISLRHAEKAAAAGVDGLIAVCAGAGGHAGRLSPFALVPEIRAMFPGIIALSGALSTGAHIAAARLIGADLGYLGTRFIATEESLAPPAYKQMVLDATAKDIVYTDEVSGVPANFLAASLRQAGLAPESLSVGARPELKANEDRAWKHIWSAGQGVGSVRDMPGAAALCARLTAEYRDATAALAGHPGPG